jgi:hypothetical protein
LKFIELKNSLGYKYQDAGWALASFDHIAMEKDVFEMKVTKELSDEYSELLIWRRSQCRIIYKRA